MNHYIIITRLNKLDILMVSSASFIFAYPQNGITFFILVILFIFTN